MESIMNKVFADKLISKKLMFFKEVSKLNIFSINKKETH